jgi:hypothetical protein
MEKWCNQETKKDGKTNFNDSMTVSALPPEPEQECLANSVFRHTPVQGSP